MSEYSLIVPDDKKFFNALLVKLMFNDEKELVSLLRGVKCSFEDTGCWSYKYDGQGRYGANAALVHFFVPVSKLSLLNKEEIKEKLLVICSNLVSDRGFDIKRVTVDLDIDLDNSLDEDIIEDLNSEAKLLSQNIISVLIPEDLRIKGFYMAEVYTYLYTVENALRLFVEKVGTETYGIDFFEKFKGIQKVQNNVNIRKEKATINKWLSLRGDNDLFFIDFSDLGSIISSNWNIFESYFPNQPWIITKLAEMTECRNLIAHNSYVSKSEKDLIKSYFNSILEQLDIKLKNKDDFLF